MLGNSKCIDGMISVIVPVYMVEDELDRCIQSILNQTYSNIEVILVDDGSKDDCPQMCDDYARRDKRVVVIHKENGGLSSARNAGLRIATGEYVLYVDSDDYIELDACERFMTVMSDDVDFVVGACRMMKGSRSYLLTHDNLNENTVYDVKEFVIRSVKNNDWNCYIVLNFFRRDFLISNNLFFRNGYLLEDMEILPRIYLRAKKVMYVNYPFYNYIVRSDSLTTSENIGEKRTYASKIYEDWLGMFSEEDDVTYRRYLYAGLVNYYLWGCRAYQMRDWEVSGINFMFVMRYAVGMKDRLKGILLRLVPDLYLKISV